MIKYVAIILGIMVFVAGIGVLAYAAVGSDDGGKKVVKFDQIKKCDSEEGCTTVETIGDHKGIIWKSIKDLVSGKAKVHCEEDGKKVVKFGDHVVICGSCDVGNVSCDCGGCDEDCCGDCDEDCCGDCGDCDVVCEVICELECDADCGGVCCEAECDILCEDEDVICTVGGDGKTKTIKITHIGDEVICEEISGGKKVQRKFRRGDKDIGIIHGGDVHKLLKSDGAHAELLLKGLHEGHEGNVLMLEGGQAELLLKGLHKGQEGKLLKLKGGDGDVLLKLLHEGQLEGIDEEHVELLKHFNVPKPPVAPHPPHGEPSQGNERKIHHLKAAAENLHAAGMHQEAEKLMQKAMSLEKARKARRVPAPRRSVRGNDDLHEAIQDLRRQVQELHGVVRDLKERMEGVKNGPARYRLRRTSDGNLIGVGGGRIIDVPHADGEVTLGIAVGGDDAGAALEVIPKIKVIRGVEDGECIECDCNDCDEECEEIEEIVEIEI